MKARYRCLACDHQWRDAPGAVCCPKCCPGRNQEGHSSVCTNHYIKWLNYEKDFARKARARKLEKM